MSQGRPPGSGSARLGVVVIHFHREQDAARVVRDVVAQGVPASQVVLVDNGSTGEILDDALSSEGVDPQVLRCSNLGFAGGANVGVRELPDSVEVVAVLSHEVELGPDCLATLAEVVQSDPAVGAAGPLLLRSGPEALVWSAGGRSTRILRDPRHHLAGVPASSVPGDLLDAEWLDGSVLVLRTELWRRMGGLDEQFFLYQEDVDLGWRLRALGLRVVVVPRVWARQSPAPSQDPEAMLANMLLLLRKHGRRMLVALWAAGGLAVSPRRSRAAAIRRALAVRLVDPASRETRA